jgi:hypothetical protein
MEFGDTVVALPTITIRQDELQSRYGRGGEKTLLYYI